MESVLESRPESVETQIGSERIRKERMNKREGYAGSESCPGVKTERGAKRVKIELPNENQGNCCKIEDDDVDDEFAFAFLHNDDINKTNKKRDASHGNSRYRPYFARNKMDWTGQTTLCTANDPVSLLQKENDKLKQGLADKEKTHTAEVAELKRQLAAKQGHEGNTENKGGSSKPAKVAPAPPETQVDKSNSSAEQPPKVTGGRESTKAIDKLQRNVENLNKIKHLLPDGEYTKQIQGLIDRS